MTNVQTPAVEGGGCGSHDNSGTRGSRQALTVLQAPRRLTLSVLGASAKVSVRVDDGGGEPKVAVIPTRAAPELARAFVQSEQQEMRFRLESERQFIRAVRPKRLRGIDVEEANPDGADRLQELLDGGAVTYTAAGTDRYGRTLAHVFVDGADVGELLIKENHALRWKPGPQAKAARLAVWCGS